MAVNILDRIGYTWHYFIYWSRLRILVSLLPLALSMRLFEVKESMTAC